MHQLMHSFHGMTAPAEILDAVRRGDIPAFCLFRYSNVESPAQLRELCLSLRKAAEDGGLPPPIIGVDQEGGQLIAISGGATELPGNMAIGATRDPQLAEQAGRVLGRELLAMGINMNFAPSLDVNINPENPVIGVRSFGDNPQLVAEMGAAMIRGLQAEGVIATAKHFPGHGDVAFDPHHTAPVITHTMERVDAVELVPFRAALAAGVGAVMTAHIQFNALDRQQPATLSTLVLGGLLRDEMGYEGLSITDAMDMYAVAQFGALNSVTAALNAGADLVLLGHLTDQMLLNEQTRALIRPDAVARIKKAQETSPRILPPLEVVGCAEHQQIAQTIADRSITVVKGRQNLPLRPDGQIAVIVTQPADLTPADTSSQVQIKLADAIRKRHANVLALELSREASQESIGTLLAQCAEASAVVVATIDAYRDSTQQEVIRALHKRGQQPIVVSMRTPYDLMSFPEVATYLCAYSIRDVSMEAVTRVLFGEVQATGQLPCKIPGI
ncbi:MAG: glycoside hydrolase family 3 N-terminal domain-containing protein [Anaerolineae bacterium]